MPAPRIIALAITAALFLAVGACATTRSSPLTGSTLHLQRSADILADDAVNIPQVPGDESSLDINYERDARALAASASDLLNAVEKGASDADVRVAFNRVSRSLHTVRDEVSHSDNQQAHADLRAVTASYREVGQQLGEHPGESPAS